MNLKKSFNPLRIINNRRTRLLKQEGEMGNDSNGIWDAGWVKRSRPNGILAVRLSSHRSQAARAFSNISDTIDLYIL